jgi:transposase InsO family protein
VGPLSASSKGNKYILTVKDCFTRWIEAFPIVAATALATIDILVKEIFCRYGVPEIIHSDRGNQFTSNLFHSVAQEYGIQVTTTPAYNPKSNPVERVHCDLGTMLRALSYDTHQDWEDLLPKALFAIRTAVSKSIGLAPYQLLFGRDASQPIHIAFGKPPPQGDLDYHRYAEQLRNRIDNAQTYAREKIALAITRQRRNYNQDAKEINVGQKVWLFTPVTRTGESRKKQNFGQAPG